MVNQASSPELLLIRGIIIDFQGPESLASSNHSPEMGPASDRRPSRCFLLCRMLVGPPDLPYRGGRDTVDQ